jgi:uncharacterized repeat protein (TIGR03803 family)
MTTSYNSLYPFGATSASGTSPIFIVSLPSLSSSTLYGTTNAGGDFNKGVLFSYDISRNEVTNLHTFGSGTDTASNPSIFLLYGNSQTLYGITDSGGDYNSGTLYKYNFTTHTQEVIYSFGNTVGFDAPDGSFPSFLLEDGNIIYGTCAQGGDYGGGTIYFYNVLNRTSSKLYSFGNGNDPSEPGYISLIGGNKICCLSVQGGNNMLGTIFTYDITLNTINILYNFGSTINDGVSPIIFCIKGSIMYGITRDGGSFNLGTIFSFDLTNNQYSTLFHFSGTNDGSLPIYITEINDVLYGTTLQGGTNNKGVLYSYDINTGTQIVLHSFGGTLNNNLLDNTITFDNKNFIPDIMTNGPLVSSPDGFLPIFLTSLSNVLYGVTLKGGINFSGTLYSYRLKPIPPICFHEKTRLLCFDPVTRLDNYIEIKELKVGNIVKTYKHGYRKVKYLYKGTIKNNPKKWSECMYLLRKGRHGLKLTEDLMITGQHSILLPRIEASYRDKFDNIHMKIPQIDGLYMVNAGLSSLFEKICRHETFTIYHVVLENDGDKDKQYGVWANGILSETLSERSYQKRNFLPGQVEKMQKTVENVWKERKNRLGKLTFM